ncbi:unnamed protein product [Caenorhabditis bovis]|uniref:Uncharacterized protein n=1 Tax=Caenorhabditis bovis TaxID=2654633 RepID=A0A8S1EPC6_9PELO|nr:unnamed protein product [Caenorhabditis bovis]
MFGNERVKHRKRSGQHIVENRTIACLDDCTCEKSDHDPVIRCDSLGLERFPLPHSTPLTGYNFLALTCNDLSAIPSISLIKASFPDLQGIDVQGNPKLNCTELEFLKSDIPVLSDCQKTDAPIQCDNLDKNCDWKCRSLKKLKKLWEEFKQLLDRKAKEWGADETYESIKSWFAKQFSQFAQATGIDN